jgi:LmbE family N-acetylglucosaminyl deacetylase
MIIVTDGAQGAANTSVPRGPEIARLRVEEARCAAHALGVQPSILLGFPDGALGHYNADPALLYRVTQRVHEEIQRLRPDAVITWGPDGGYGHADHRMVSSIVTQLARAGALASRHGSSTPFSQLKAFARCIRREGFHRLWFPGPSC